MSVSIFDRVGTCQAATLPMARSERLLDRCAEILGEDLVLWATVPAAPPLPLAGVGEAVILLHPPSAFSIRCFDGDGGGAPAKWQPRRRLRVLIILTLTFMPNKRCSTAALNGVPAQESSGTTADAFSLSLLRHLLKVEGGAAE